MRLAIGEPPSVASPTQASSAAQGKCREPFPPVDFGIHRAGALDPGDIGPIGRPYPPGKTGHLPRISDFRRSDDSVRVMSGAGSARRMKAYLVEIPIDQHHVEATGAGRRLRVVSPPLWSWHKRQTTRRRNWI